MSVAGEHPAVVIGAGVSGLAAARALREQGITPLVLESNPEPGGAVSTVRRDGFLCESGPNTLRLSKPEAAEFLERLGLLQTACDAAPQARKRFLVRNQTPVAIPSSLSEFFSSPVFSWRMRAALLREMWAPRGDDPDESIAAFVRRRLGGEWLEEVVSPFISGIYGGDPESILVRHAWPRLHQMEQKAGSVTFGMLKKMGRKSFRSRMISWPEGMRQLVLGLATGLEVKSSVKVEGVRRDGEFYRVGAAGTEWKTRRLVLATSSLVAARLFPDAAALATVPHAPIAVVHLGFKREAVGHPLDGFGVLIRRGLDLRSLGILFSSTLFPGRSPDGSVLLTIFLGGRLDPTALELSEQALIQTAVNDATTLLKIRSEPGFSRVTRWPAAIPQYEEHHDRILAECDAVERRNPGLRLVGSYRGGVSLEDCLMNGHAAVRNPA